MNPMRWCPYKDCGFGGTETEVDDHRSIPGIHMDQPEAGSNLKHRPRD